MVIVKLVVLIAGQPKSYLTCKNNKSECVEKEISKKVLYSSGTDSEIERTDEHISRQKSIYRIINSSV